MSTGAAHSSGSEAPQCSRRKSTQRGLSHKGCPVQTLRHRPGPTHYSQEGLKGVERECVCANDSGSGPPKCRLECEREGGARASMTMPEKGDGSAARN